MLTSNNDFVSKYQIIYAQTITSVSLNIHIYIYMYIQCCALSR